MTPSSRRHLLALCSRMGCGMPFNSTSPTSTNRIAGFRVDHTTSSLTKTSPDPAFEAILAAVLTVLPK